MNAHPIYSKAELVFWDTVIFMLDEVKPFQKIVQTAYRYYEDGSLFRFALTTVKVAVAGLLSGISLSLILSIFG